MADNIIVSSAWDAVTKGAVKFATDQINAKAFHALVVTYAEARKSAEPKTTSPSGAGGPTMPFGRTKGRPIASAPIDDIEWMLGVVTQSIDDPSKARFRDNNVKLAGLLQARVDTENGVTQTKTSPADSGEDVPF